MSRVSFTVRKDLWAGARRHKKPRRLSPRVGVKKIAHYPYSLDHEIVAAAKESCEKNGCDLVVGNDLRDIKDDNHRLFMVNKQGLKRICYSKEGEREYLAQQVALEAYELV